MDIDSYQANILHHDKSTCMMRRDNKNIFSLHDKKYQGNTIRICRDILLKLSDHVYVDTRSKNIYSIRQNLE